MPASERLHQSEDPRPPAVQFRCYSMSAIDTVDPETGGQCTGPERHIQEEPQGPCHTVECAKSSNPSGEEHCRRLGIVSPESCPRGASPDRSMPTAEPTTPWRPDSSLGVAEPCRVIFQCKHVPSPLLSAYAFPGLRSERQTARRFMADQENNSYTHAATT